MKTGLKLDPGPSEESAEQRYERMLITIAQSAARAIAERRGLIDRLGLRAAIRDPEVIAIRRSGLFDPEFYLATYGDVAAARIDPLYHYIQSGDEEGRWPNAFFDPTFYRGRFAQKGRWPFSALYHYVTAGEAAGLQPSAAFNASKYLSGEDGMGSWIDQPLAHFLWIGRHDGLSPQGSGKRPADQAVNFRRPPAVPPLASGLARAFNVVGPLDRIAGLGVSARAYLAAITEAKVGPVGALPLRREFAAQSPAADRAAFPRFRPDAAINLIHMGGDTLPQMLNSGEGALMNGRYNIGVWYWELPTLRPEWQGLVEHFNAFWAPTPFIARALAQSTAKPVRLIPPYLAYLNAFRPRGNFDRNPPHFVYCFDANSVIERKNPGLLLDAFLAAFPQQFAARLTFKVTYPNKRIPELARLYAAAEGQSNIQIIDRTLSDAELHRLIGSATAYVSPHRSEGLGLTVVEAMALEVPVIGTPFGGVDQLILSDTAWPLAYRLTELSADHGPYPRGFVWAEPHLGSLINAMQAVASNPVEARTRALRARELVLERFASTDLISAVRSELEATAAVIGL